MCRTKITEPRPLQTGLPGATFIDTSINRSASMFLPKLGDAPAQLWFVSGIGVLDRTPYHNKLGGGTCYPLIALGAAPLNRAAPEARPPFGKASVSGREVYLN